MTLSDLPPTSATDRLERLELRVRWLTTVSLMLTLAFAALLAWQLYPRSRPFEAPGFVLLDSHGRRRAELGLRDDGAPILRLNNQDQRARAALFLRNDGSAILRLADGGGVYRAALTVGADGAPELTLGDPGGRAIVRVGLAPDGSGAIALRDSAHHTIWSAPGH
jgi:hypothetical protein